MFCPYFCIIYSSYPDFDMSFKKKFLELSFVKVAVTMLKKFYNFLALKTQGHSL